jgi:hypothetical protein
MTTYNVGKGKPPKHSQFRPGQSGNPSGRRKGSQNLKTVVRKILSMPVRIHQNGRNKKVSTQNALLLSVRNNALKNERWAVEMLLELADRHNNEALEIPADRILPSEDQAIIEHFKREIIATTLANPATARVEGRRKPKVKKIE